MILRPIPLPQLGLKRNIIYLKHNFFLKHYYRKWIVPFVQLLCESQIQDFRTNLVKLRELQ